MPQWLLSVFKSTHLLSHLVLPPMHSSPQVSAEQTQQQLVGDLLDRAFEGSAQRLVMQALSAKRVTPEELTQIRALLDEIEGGENEPA